MSQFQDDLAFYAAFLEQGSGFIGHKQQEKPGCEIYVVFMFGFFIQQCWQHFFTLQSAGADYKQRLCALVICLDLFLARVPRVFGSEDCNFLWKSLLVFINYSGFSVPVVREAGCQVSV